MNKKELSSLAYTGQCEFAASTGKLDVEGGRHQLTINGTTYTFSNVVAKALFKWLPNRIEKADSNWKNR